MRAGLTGKLRDHSLSLEALVLLHVWVMAELVLGLQLESWAHPGPQAGNTGAFWGLILMMF